MGMNTQTQDALKLALEALEYIHEGANNQGPHTGISWRCVSNKAEPAITAIREALADSALDRMAENARELGLDYEPPCKTGSQCTNKCQQCEHPAQEPVAWMYQCSADSSGPVFMQHKRDWAESGSGLWTEKPLYTSPQPAQQQKEGFASPGGGYVPAIPRPIPLDWKLVPRKATPEMLRAMDECAQEGYDERLYAGMASSVYMAAWDASLVMGTLPEQPAQQSHCNDCGGFDPECPLAQPAQQQEPVFWYRPCSNGMYEGPIHNAQIERVRKDSGSWHPLYTSPPASKPWVGLSTSELDEIDAPIRERGSATIAEIYRAIEAKLREKNA